jgi:hypothetical protein
VPRAKPNAVALTNKELKALAAGRTPGQIGKAVLKMVAGGRRRKELDLNRLVEMRMAGCPISEIAAEFDIDEKSIDTRLRKDPVFKAMFDRGDERGKAAIRVAQYKKAVTEKHMTALIWAGKQRLGQKDQIETGGADRLNEVLAVLMHAKVNQGDDNEDESSERGGAEES